MIRIGVGLKILACTPIPKLPTSYYPMPTLPPPKEIYTFLKMFPISKVFKYQKNQWLFIKEKKIKFSKQNQIILAQNDDGPLKWANDPYIPFKVMQISKFQWAF